MCKHKKDWELNQKVAKALTYKAIKLQLRGKEA
jgi:hypothetical protein